MFLAVIKASGTQQPPKLFKKDWDKIEKDIKKMVCTLKSCIVCNCIQYRLFIKGLAYHQCY